MNNNNQIIKQKYNFFDDIANKYKEYNNLINNDNLNKLKNFSENREFPW